MKTTRRNTYAFKENESGNVKHSEPVDIHRIKLWATANLPARSHLRGILLLEGNLLTAHEFLAKMDLWLKLVELEGHSLN